MGHVCMHEKSASKRRGNHAETSALEQQTRLTSWLRIEVATCAISSLFSPAYARRVAVANTEGKAAIGGMILDFGM